MTDRAKVDLMKLVGNMLEGQHGDVLRQSLPPAGASVIG